MRFLFQLFARKCHCGLWPDQNLAWPKKEAEEVRTWKNLCGFYLPVNTRHRPTSLRHCQVGPMVGQILPCEPSKRPADFHKTWTKERKRSEAPALRTLARFLKQQFRNFAKWCFLVRIGLELNLTHLQCNMTPTPQKIIISGYIFCLECPTTWNL